MSADVFGWGAVAVNAVLLIANAVLLLVNRRTLKRLRAFIAQTERIHREARHIVRDAQLTIAIIRKRAPPP